MSFLTFYYNVQFPVRQLSVIVYFTSFVPNLIFLYFFVFIPFHFWVKYPSAFCWFTEPFACKRGIYIITLISAVNVRKWHIIELLLQNDGTGRIKTKTMKNKRNDNNKERRSHSSPYRSIATSGRNGRRYKSPRRRSGGSGWVFLILVIVAAIYGLWYPMRSLQEDGATNDQPSNMTQTSGISSPHSTPDSSLIQSSPETSASEESLAVDATIKVQILDVGQGLSVLLTCGDEAMLYDGGGRDTSSFVVAYLKNQGIETLNYVVVSHYDSDHLAGVIGAINVFDVETLIAPNYTADTKLYASFERAVQDYGLTVTSPVPGDTYSFGSGVFQILAPLGTDYENENDYSVVLRVSLGDSSLLLTGDATEISENEILENGTKPASNVLLAGHHGSAGSTSEAFLKEVSPDYAIISCGSGNSYGHPAKRVVELLEANSIPLYRTDLQGTISFTLTSQDISFDLDPCNDYTSGSELYGYQDRSGDWVEKQFKHRLFYFLQGICYSHCRTQHVSNSRR